MSPILTTAFKAARKAGHVMTRAAGQIGSIKFDNKAHNDFVSEVDREAEHILISALNDAYPDHAVLSEESGLHGSEKADYRWVIDPLDGTTNFLHGHRQYAVSMALLHKNVLTEALVFAPEYNDLYTATRGQGAFLNDKRIRVSTRIELPQCLISTGFPVVDQSITDPYLAILKELFAKTAGVRREGAASLDLCNVAAGRADGFFEFNLKPWDTAAGALLVQEAGGLVTDTEGGQTWSETGNIVAGNAKVLAALLRIIGKNKAA